MYFSHLVDPHHSRMLFYQRQACLKRPSFVTSSCLFSATSQVLQVLTILSQFTCPPLKPSKGHPRRVSAVQQQANAVPVLPDPPQTSTHPAH